MSETEQSNALPLPGLDGSNPLAFLAALGTLRMLSEAWPEGCVKMNWTQHGGGWRPGVVAATGPQHALDAAQVLDAMNEHLPQSADVPAFAMADDLAVEVAAFRGAAEDAREHAAANADRRWCDFLAAFGCEAFTDPASKQPIIQDTALRTMSGAGHQHFLRFMRNLIAQTTREHLHKTLFEVWRYDDPVASMTLRWDPIDDDPYALRWRNPSGDPARNQRGSMWGAYRLAIEALPLLPTMPGASRVETTGFVGRGSRDTYWTWPVWTSPISIHACQSLLSCPLIQEAAEGDQKREKERREQLREIGIARLFRAQRITIGKYRAFTPARAV